MDPLLLATHKRLEELEKEKAPSGEPPSLMVQIQNAPDLTILDALKIDGASRDPQIQPKLMGFIRKRHFELENQPVSQPKPNLIIYWRNLSNVETNYSRDSFRAKAATSAAFREIHCIQR